MTARGWLAFLGAAVAVTAVVLGLLAAFGAESAPKASTPTVAVAQSPNPMPLPDLGGPRSQLVPEVTLPVGAQPYMGKTPTPPGFEFWEVPGTHGELVAKMRSELPTFAPLNGRPWCGEVSDNMTSWAWGSADETIGVSLIDGGVLITRLPQPKGCRP